MKIPRIVDSLFAVNSLTSIPRRSTAKGVAHVFGVVLGY